MHVLIVDSDRALCEELRAYLEGEAFSVTMIHDGEQGLETARSEAVDILVMDVVLPRLGGLQLLRQLRSHSNVPVLVLSARAEEVDRIVGLELGADDYMAKPCNHRELSARLRAIGRRTKSPVDDVSVSGVTLRAASRSVTLRGQPVSLTTVEFEILSRLIRSAGQVVTRQELTGTRDGEHPDPFDRSIDMHISRLRRKLDGHGAGPLIKTIHGVGYQFLCEDPRSSMGQGEHDSTFRPREEVGLAVAAQDRTSLMRS